MKCLIPTLLLLIAAGARADDAVAPKVQPVAQQPASKEKEIVATCEKDLRSFPGPKTEALIDKACAKVVQDPECVSAEGRAIYHYDHPGTDPKGKRVLVFSLIHGDETPAGSVGRYWMERLEGIEPRNTWRVVPVLNPDGVVLKTRTNARNIDLNRNFPTKDWEALAQKLWKSQTSSNPRRFPGDAKGTEPEVKCALKQIDDFKPDFIVSIHTPLKVLDFDGPKLKAKPRFDYLPWRSLGTFPGSLGRYMWTERNTPVLTAELAEGLPSSYRPFESLQDIIGTLVKVEIPQRPGPAKVVRGTW